MIAIVDYGVGNLFSLCGALNSLGLGEEIVVSGEAEVLARAQRIILPGVGAFGDAVNQFRAKPGLEAALNQQVAAGKPLLGICVGMQLLFQAGYEFGVHKGLGYLPGSIHSLANDIPGTLKVPHIGWNSLTFQKPDCPLLHGLTQGDYVYFVHSFYAKGCGDAVAASCTYGVEIPALVHHENVYGTQFHPEKSGAVGQCLLQAFCTRT